MIVSCCVEKHLLEILRQTKRRSFFGGQKEGGGDCASFGRRNS